MFIQSLNRFLLPVLLLAAPGSQALSQTNPFWGNLARGPYAVGFRSLWRFDSSRNYNMKFDDGSYYASAKAARPILINIWYPARGQVHAKTMLERDYLDFGSNDPQLATFSRRLIEYDKRIITQEIIGKPAGSLSNDERSLLETFFDTPTAAIRDATLYPGRFPLVIYHSGAGSSIEDNSVLCEFLASHGYVVINSAYQRADGSSFNIDGNEGSVLDLKYLISYARELSDVKRQSIGILGHSAGAQAVMIFQSRNASGAGALISLDTTEDYASLLDHRWDRMTQPVLSNIQNLSVPMLVVAKRPAIFQMCDLLRFADRYYLTTTSLSHNDFISQGVIKKTLKNRLNAASSEGAPAGELSPWQLDFVRSDYEAVCQYVLSFLGATLKNDANGRDSLRKRYRGNRFDGRGPLAEYVPRGTTAPEKYDINSSMPPSPRQIRYIVAEKGTDITLGLLRKFWKQGTTDPLYEIDFAYALVDELLERNKTDALAFYNLYTELSPMFRTIPAFMVIWGNLYLRQGDKAIAIHLLQKALILDPGNKEARAKLSKAEDPTANPR